MSHPLKSHKILRLEKTEKPIENVQSRGRHNTLYEDRQKNYKVHSQINIKNTDPTKTCSKNRGEPGFSRRVSSTILEK